METIIRFFQDGGVFMYPIAIVLIVGIAMVIDRWVFLTKAKRINREAFDKIQPMLNQGDIKGVLSLGKNSEAPVAKIVAAGLLRMQHSRKRDDVELAMEEGVLEAVPQLEKRTNYLATLANIATLLGLLGTIMGLIAAFTAVAEADPSQKATLLSQSISVAMNTTAFGLMSAIPLMMFHAMLVNKTTEIVDSLEMSGVKVLNTLFRLATNKANTDKA